MRPKEINTSQYRLAQNESHYYHNVCPEKEKGKENRVLDWAFPEFHVVTEEILRLSGRELLR